MPIFAILLKIANTHFAKSNRMKLGLASAHSESFLVLGPTLRAAVQARLRLRRRGRVAGRADLRGLGGLRSGLGARHVHGEPRLLKLAV